ncbi:Beta-ketoacyl synthase protein [Ancylostoma duodenale]|uniref:beta-ketoacyl-[acyl-carrier-protein] synthase I n=1 Tax=Ancylostoma duodenale TaxID=51022 RepID=A0A0C2GMK2_9BILA|nr:Beta-ketoacyl synthase protein [Ancylostoma duodenale]
MHRVVITGMGAVTPYGGGVATLQKGLLESRSALKFSEQLGFVVRFLENVGAIPDGSVDFDRWSAGQKREMSRASQLALIAAEEPSEFFQKSFTLFCTKDINQFAGWICSHEVDGHNTILQMLGLLSVTVFRYGMMGGAESAATACATGLHCIGNAFRSVRQGWSRRAIAGAAEGCVNAVALAGFDRMRALSHGKDPSCSRPFDKKRDGFVLSEGVGLVLLERLQDALDRGAPILAEVLGYGISSDCYHISSPDPSGIGARLSMQRAIDDAKIRPDDVTYVNAHATSTPTGDTIEA